MTDPGEEWLREGLGGPAPQPVPTPEEREYAHRVHEVWQRWSLDQMRRCRTMRFRRMVVELISSRLTGDETEVPAGLHDQLDTIVALDQMEQPDNNPEMHPDYAQRLWAELLDELRRKGKR